MPFAMCSASCADLPGTTGRAERLSGERGTIKAAGDILARAFVCRRFYPDLYCPGSHCKHTWRLLARPSVSLAPGWRNRAHHYRSAPDRYTHTTPLLLAETL